MLFPKRRLQAGRSARRGVLILVVLSLLALFMMMGVAYVLTTGQYHAMSRSRSSDRVYMSEVRETMDAAMYQVLRDTKNARSVVRYHSLLNDLYGNDGFMGQIGSASTTTGTGGLFFNVAVGSVESATDGRPHALSTTLGAYAGCVFTVVTGSEIGSSTRIVGYDGAGTLTVMSWTTRSGRTANPANLSGARFVVNGRPFNGMGAAYNPATGKCDLMEPAGGTSGQMGLLPNRCAKFGYGTPTPGYDWGGMDESYDAADYQNMFLAFLPADYVDDDVNRLPIPSFYRPELYKLWTIIRGTPNPFTNALNNFPPRAMMRPMSGSLSGEINFPNFPISSLPGPPAQFGTGPYDVDNDGDSMYDSVWVDLGFPDATSPQGFNYRPIFAFLIIDLDGRFNLNAQGNSAHIDSTYYNIPGGLVARGSVSSTLPFAGSSGSITPARGQGVGPADIHLDGGALSLTPLITAAEYQALLQGNANYPGRYGVSSDGMAGPSGLLPKNAWTKLFGIPANFYNSGIFSAYLLGRPIDDRGELAIGLAHNGGPIYETPTGSDLRIGSPYLLDLSRNAPKGALTTTSDAPFSVNELESLLRPYDRDSSGLPQRIANLAPNLYSSQTSRRLYTTESESLPVPYVNVPRTVRSNTSINYETVFGSSAQGNNVRVPAHIADVLKQRLTSSGLSSSAANTELLKMLPPELLRGELFDLNRLFGNGQDDNTNFVVDEPSETGEVLQYPTASSSTNVSMDYTNGDPLLANTPLGARQLMARHLYCLAMLLRDNVNIDFDGNAGNNSAAETARGIAQWAINVVDFRDADSIMTPFEYDPNPFNGWAPDGNLATTGEAERGVVWGLERPELLITETIAWHDRASEDRMDDPSMKKYAGGGGDPDFDQRLQPKGAAFIELFNPWVGQDKYPAELYTNNSGTPVLNLNRLDSTGTSPIWRILVVQDTSRESQTSGSPLYYDADTVNPDFGGSSANVERSIYFSNNFSGITSGHGEAFYPSSGALVSSISPGGYAVIGSSGKTQGSTYVSQTGHLTSDPDGQDTNIASTRRVVLSPSTNQVSVLSNNGGTSTTSTAAAIAIDSPRSFNISDPNGGYTSANFSVVAGSEGKYNPILTSPLDVGRTGPGNWGALLINGTTQDFRTILLQRLANPLQPWNQQTNPYITIDTSSMNLTAFNGADSTTDPAVSSTVATGNLVSFQRGRVETLNQRTLWRHETYALPSTQLAGSSHFEQYALRHSLGYLNEQYGSYGQSYPNDITGYTFPWLMWNNRPFISPMELLVVPRSKASRFAFDYTPLTSTTITSGKLTANYQAEAGTYGHLMNFFDCRTGTGQNLYRLLEYVGVPSPFVGTREILNPDPTLTESFGKTSAPNGFRAPLNSISRFRNPGRFNINTISDQHVWYSITNLAGGSSGPFWQQLVTSRRGYGAESNVIQLNGPFPSYFLNPFRAAGTGELVPYFGWERNDIDVTLLRSYPDTTSGTAMHTAGSAPFLSTLSSSKYNQADRNPYFRYEAASRISNMVTYQSNVYAVWVTMGYFVTYPVGAAGDTGLWNELGIESTGGERHRAFYIIDRSIPVAFEPGENHNVDDAILVRRILD